MKLRLDDLIGAVGIFGAVGLGCLLIGGGCIGLPFWTDRTLEFWLSRWSDHAVNVPWILSALATWFSAGAALPINIVSEIARLCL